MTTRIESPRRAISDAEWATTRCTITRSVQAERLHAGRARALARMPRGCAEQMVVLGRPAPVDQTSSLPTLPDAWGAPALPRSPSVGARALRACRGAVAAIGCLALAGACAGAAIGAGVLLGGGSGL